MSHLCTLHNADAKTSVRAAKVASNYAAVGSMHMEMALTLIAMASFFGLILAWIVLPASETRTTEAVQPLTQPQIAA